MMSAQPSAPPAAPAATRQVVVFVLDQEEYAVPIQSVKEVVKIPKITLVPNGQAFVLGVINLRGQIVPVLDLEELFHLPHEHESKPEHIIITEDDAHTLIGIQVDKVSEVLRIAEADVKPTPKLVTSRVSADYAHGVIILSSSESSSGSERMLLLLDLAKIVTDKAQATTTSPGSTQAT
jgi:purine-binding chemotaxis protein CheW